MDGENLLLGGNLTRRHDFRDRDRGLLSHVAQNGEDDQPRVQARPLADDANHDGVSATIADHVGPNPDTPQVRQHVLHEAMSHVPRSRKWLSALERRGAWLGQGRRSGHLEK